jgi:hypothetical protein
VRVLIEQIFTGQGPDATKHHDRAGSSVRVDLPAGPSVRAVLGEVTHDLSCNTSTRDGTVRSPPGVCPTMTNSAGSSRLSMGEKRRGPSGYSSIHPPSGG